MKNKTTIKALLIVSLLSLSTTTFAQKPATTKLKVKTEAHASTTAEKFAHTQTKAVEMIDSRIDSLNKLSSRLNEMKKISVDQKTSFTADIQAEILSLSDLKTKILSETSTSTVKTDTKSITEAYRIFALIEPKIRITASADRELVIADMFNTVLVKIQARLASSTSSVSTSTSVKTALAEMIAKIADIRVQANAAITLVTPLKPDNGDKTVMASNAKALKDAKSKIQAGQKDIEAARKAAKTIAKAIKEVREENKDASSTKSSN